MRDCRWVNGGSESFKCLRSRRETEGHGSRFTVRHREGLREFRADGEMATTTTTTKGLTSEETDTTNSATLSTMAASLALNNRVYSLDDFDTVATVGTGTFGRVFLVKDKKTRDFFALKAMKIPDVIRLKQEQHVHNEKEVLTEVNHPFLIRL
ncbi:hypothetical protein AMELA_G00232770 [Ameiurus melas]|uniref:Protein kinase domain-containing protein n=1 Tax=Ameiurus melas TaxID=219545 RepID=A0A7J5ZXS4_AMEME|nr:hypothetical protein AMELA_G00232770 [Ameiurus melas]